MNDINSLSCLVFSIIAIGLATYGISTIATQEPGPFAVFDRIREALLSECGKVDGHLMPRPTETLDVKPSTPRPIPIMLPSDSSPSVFERTLRGTLHGIMDCAICMGLWLSFPLALLALIMGLMAWQQFPLVWLSAYGFHRFLLGVVDDI